MFKFIISQVALTSLTLGALKRNNIILLDASKVRNETLRTVIVKGIEAGESAAWWVEYAVEQGSKFVSDATKSKK
jgi:hypothetical protein